MIGGGKGEIRKAKVSYPPRPIQVKTLGCLVGKCFDDTVGANHDTNALILQITPETVMPLISSARRREEALPGRRRSVISASL